MAKHHLPSQTLPSPALFDLLILIEHAHDENKQLYFVQNAALFSFSECTEKWLRQ